MTATTVVRASKELKTETSTVRKVFDAHDRAREIYFQQMNRAKADYIERIKQAMTLITGEDEQPIPETVSADQPTQPVS